MRPDGYNRSHKWQCTPPRKCGTQQQGGSQEIGELTKSVYETGSRNAARQIRKTPPENGTNAHEAHEKQDCRQCEERNLQDRPCFRGPLIDKLISKGLAKPRRLVFVFAGRPPLRSEKGRSSIGEQNCGDANGQNRRKLPQNHRVKQADERQAEQQGRGRPARLAHSHCAEKIDKAHGHKNGEEKRITGKNAQNQLNRSDNHANPEALMAQIIHVPGILDSRPENALQPAVAAAALA